ncbi:MAG: ABC transporter permease, partial [Pseudomonadota bacterium]
MDQWYQLRTKNGLPHIFLTGSYTLAALEDILEPLTSELTNQAKNRDLYWDLTGIQQMDTAGVVKLWRVWKS